MLFASTTLPALFNVKLPPVVTCSENRKVELVTLMLPEALSVSVCAEVLIGPMLPAEVVMLRLLLKIELATRFADLRATPLVAVTLPIVIVPLLVPVATPPPVMLPAIT